jgi:PAS domain S-box-containing protein
MTQVFDSANYTLALPALPPFVVGVLIAALGIGVLLRERVSPVSVTFCLVTTSASIWLLCCSAIYSTVNESLIRWWVSVEHLGIVFIPSLVSIFTLAVTKWLRDHQALAWSSLALSSLFYLGALSTDWFITGLRQYSWGYNAQYGPLSLPFLLFFFGTMLACLRAYWVESQRASGIRRQRLKALLLAFSVGYLGSVDFLPAYGVPVYPFGYLPVLGFVALTAQAIWRYRLVDITPAFAAEHIIKTLADALLVLDHDGHIRIVNPAACQLLGKSEAELLGAPIETAGRSLFKPDLLDKLIRNDIVRDHEITLPARHDGIEALSVTASVLWNQAGEPLATVCLARDITQRQRAEEELRRSGQLLAEAQELAHLGSWDWEIPTNTVTWSAELHRIYGLTPQEFGATYAAFLERVHPDDRENVKRVIESAYRDQEPFTFYHRIVRPDGMTRVLHARGNVLVDDGGRPIRMFGTGQDVTELKLAEETLRKTEEQLRQAQRLETMGKLAGAVAHDFNQLLAVVTRNCEYLLSNLGKHERLRGNLQELKHAADRAAALTQSLLAFSSRQDLRPRLLDLNALVTGLRGVLQWLVGEKIKLVTALDPALGWVNADPAQIEQIITSLAANGRDAMSEGGTLTIRTANVKLDDPMTSLHGTIPPGRYALLEVRETGGGRDVETLAHLFEPFSTSATKGPVGDVGLGLATVYGIVKQSDGYIVVTNGAERGASFKVYLPRVR